MSDMDRDSKKAAIFKLLRGYWQLAEKLNASLLDAYLDAVDDCSAESVARTCKRIAGGQAGLNPSFPPSPADIAERARAIDETVRERVPQYNGLVDMDWGHGRVDLRGLTNEEQDQIIRGHGLIGGKNAALLDLEGKRDALRTAKALAPPPPPKPAAVEPLKPWEDPDGWVEWSHEWGEFPPIDRGAQVWLKYTGDEIGHEVTRMASAVNWKERNPLSAVIAYKVKRYA